MFCPQLLFIPTLQEAINRRTQAPHRDAARAQRLRIVDEAADGAAVRSTHAFRRRIGFVYLLNVQIFIRKFGINFLMNLLYSLGVIGILAVGGWLVLHDRTEVGTIVAFISGLTRMNAPWRDLMNWFRDLTNAGHEISADRRRARKSRPQPRLANARAAGVGDRAVVRIAPSQRARTVRRDSRRRRSRSASADRGQAASIRSRRTVDFVRQRHAEMQRIGFRGRSQASENSRRRRRPRSPHRPRCRATRTSSADAPARDARSRRETRCRYRTTRRTATRRSSREGVANAAARASPVRPGAAVRIVMCVGIDGSRTTRVSAMRSCRNCRSRSTSAQP